MICYFSNIYLFIHFSIHVFDIHLMFFFKFFLINLVFFSSSPLFYFSSFSFLLILADMT